MPSLLDREGYVRPVGTMKSALLTCLLLVPMKCRHCYHKFTVFWLFTIGKQIHGPPVLRIAPISRDAGPTVAARHYAATRRRGAGHLPAEKEQRRRADAA